MNLFELIIEADAIEIDDNFIRHFHVEQEEINDDDDIAVDVSFYDSSAIHYEYMFTVKELKDAVYYPHQHWWKLQSGKEEFTLTLYTLEIISGE